MFGNPDGLIAPSTFVWGGLRKNRPTIRLTDTAWRRQWETDINLEPLILNLTNGYCFLRRNSRRISLLWLWNIGDCHRIGALPGGDLETLFQILGKSQFSRQRKIARKCSFRRGNPKLALQFKKQFLAWWLAGYVWANSDCCFSGSNRGQVRSTFSAEKWTFL